MTLTREMVDLVKEIRRRAPADEKPGIKLANPDLLIELNGLYDRCKDVVIKALIKELFALAGEPWQTMLLDTNAQQTNLMAYRGTQSLTERAVGAESPQPSSKPKRVYRGQVISS